MAAAALGFTVPPAGASGRDTPASTFWKPVDFSRLSASAAVDYSERFVLVSPADLEGTVETLSMYATLGFDLTSWLTLQAGGGSTKVDVEDADNGGMWMAGAAVGIFRHTLENPDWLSHTLSLQGAYSHWDHESDVGPSTVAWTEDRASLALNLDFPTDVAVAGGGNAPRATVFSIGGVFSLLDGEVTPDGDEFEEDSKLGLLLGLDVKLADNVVIGWQGRMYADDTLSHTAGLTLHF